MLARIRPCDDAALLRSVRKAIREGLDPLGEAFCHLVSPAERRGQGQTFTPDSVVDGMIMWARRQRRRVTRIVDPGAGSGRYTIAALKAFPHARAVAVEKDPLVALILKANLVATGLYRRARVVIGDYRQLTLPPIGITNLRHGPQPGCFMRTCKLGTHNADFVIGLWDGRVMAIECKASNSEVNGFKRLNKEVVVDAKDWTLRFGTDAVVPAAALRGVFKPSSVIEAQTQGVFLYWWHRIDELGAFLRTARE